MLHGARAPVRNTVQFIQLYVMNTSDTCTLGMYDAYIPLGIHTQGIYISYIPRICIPKCTRTCQV